MDQGLIQTQRRCLRNTAVIPITHLHVNALVVAITVLIFLISLARRGPTRENLLDAVLDGFSASQLPVGCALLAGQFGLVDPASLTTLMTSSLVGLWGALLFIGLGIIALAEVFGFRKRSGAGS